jgi:probable rRNA maturation factor
MRELQLRNRQRDRAIDTEFLREIARALLEDELALSRYELGIHFVSTKKMAEINWEFLQHEGSTDVITFDYREGYGEGAAQLDLAGEIYISVADARKQAKEFSTTWQDELVRYMAHGMLHLRGFDDLEPAKRRIMKREENRLVRRLAARFDLRKVGR